MLRSPQQPLRRAAAVLLAGFVVASCASDGSAALDHTDEAAAVVGDSGPRSLDLDAGATRRYDVQSYDVDASVTIDGDDRLDATATIVALASASLARFELDLVGLDVEAVTVDGAPAKFSHPKDVLSITPARPISSGAMFTTVVTYSGDPSQEDDPAEALEDGGGWLDVGDYSVVIAEPTGARTWLPSNDVPGDKAQVSVRVEVPAALVAVSNGRLAEQGLAAGDTGGAGGARSFHWVAAEPMAPYLITLAIGAFDLRTRTDAHGRVVTDAIPPGQDPLAASFGPTDSVVQFLSERFGPYPFADLGGIIVPGMPRTALETQTRPVYSVAALTKDNEGDQLLVHELAHQWFGNSVTPSTWNDVWLNEGPAVYSQWLWWESIGGPSVLDSARASWDPDDEALDVPPADPGDDLFGTSVYERSAMFLVELRQLMGVDDLHRLLRTWVEEHRHGTGTTKQFVELAGRIHGSPITSLSDPWLYSDELPPITF